ncbi:beta-lactamase [Bacteroidia bacterium]|nr:beta-lactamase [Bacteroidia bacterium]
MKKAVIILSTIALLACNQTAKNNELYKSDNLIIRQISPHVYEHITFLNTQDFGKVACNGIIVADENEAVVFDTPTDGQTSVELINWIAQQLNSKITAIIPMHFHVDCLGGLDEFHQRSIPSYAYRQTIVLAAKNGFVLPQNEFDSILEVPVGNKKIYAEFIGEGHTQDNIIGYFPTDSIMFGGCLIKEIGAGQGNLEDANVQAWSETVKKLKQKYPQTKIVVPGHGKYGGTELLDYTMTLFAQPN